MKRKALILPVIAAGAALLAAPSAQAIRVEKQAIREQRRFARSNRLSPARRKRWDPLTFRSTAPPFRATYR